MLYAGPPSAVGSAGSTARPRISSTQPWTTASWPRRAHSASMLSRGVRPQTDRNPYPSSVPLGPTLGDSVAAAGPGTSGPFRRMVNDTQRPGGPTMYLPRRSVLVAAVAAAWSLWAARSRPRRSPLGPRTRSPAGSPRAFGRVLQRPWRHRDGRDRLRCMREALDGRDLHHGGRRPHLERTGHVRTSGRERRDGRARWHRHMGLGREAPHTQRRRRHDLVDPPPVGRLAIPNFADAMSGWAIRPDRRDDDRRHDVGRRGDVDDRPRSVPAQSEDPVVRHPRDDRRRVDRVWRQPGTPARCCRWSGERPTSGASWTRESHAVAPGAVGCRFLDDGHGWRWHYNFADLFRTTDGGGTWNNLVGIRTSGLGRRRTRSSPDTKQLHRRGSG